jgi:hypothetical protein
MDRTLEVDIAAKSMVYAKRAWERARADAEPISVSDDVTLRVCVEHFLQTGDAGLLHAYIDRFALTEHKSPIALLAAALLCRAWKSLMHFCDHAKMMDTSARSDHEYLVQCCLPPEVAQYGVPSIIKTVTIVAHTDNGSKSIVVSELGDERIDDETLARISEATGISRNALKKHSQINSGEFRPIARLGLEPGHIGPFAPFVKDVDYFVFRQIDKPTYVALRFTPEDIVCVDRRILQPLARAYLSSMGKEYIFI